MAKPELGTKRTCLSCDAKFYDLLRNPIVCPKCQAVFVAAGVEKAPVAKPAAKPAEKPAKKSEPADEEDKPDTGDVEVVSLEEVDEDDEDDSSDEDDIPADMADVVVEVEDEEDDEKANDKSFIDDEEEGSGDVNDIVGGATKKGDEG